MKKLFIPSLLLAIILGLLLPYGAAAKNLIPYILGILLFFNFYSVSFTISDFLRKELLFYPLFVFLIVPAAVFFGTKALSPPFRTGLFLIALSPPAIAGIITTRFLKGDLKLTIITTVLYNLLAPLSYSLLTNVYFQSSGTAISMKKIFINLFLLMFIPFAAAGLLKKIEKVKPIIQKITGPASMLFPIAVYIAISYSSNRIKSLAPVELISVFAFTFLTSALLYTAGFLSGKTMEQRKALAVAMGQKNTALCIWVGLANFDPLTVIPATFYVIIHHSINTVLLLINGRSNKNKPQEDKKQ